MCDVCKFYKYILSDFFKKWDKSVDFVCSTVSFFYAGGIPFILSHIYVI